MATAAEDAIDATAEKANATAEKANTTAEKVTDHPKFYEDATDDDLTAEATMDMDADRIDAAKVKATTASKNAEEATYTAAAHTCTAQEQATVAYDGALRWCW